MSNNIYFDNNNTTEEYKFDQLLDKLENMQNEISIIKNCKKIVITGPVGVGKTTILNHFIKFNDDTDKNYIVIPEYIDGVKNAGKKLDKYLRGELSSYEFQSFVSAYYGYYLLSILPKITDKTVLVFERVPDDAVHCFIKLDRMKNRLTREEHQNLLTKIAKLNSFFDFPFYGKCAEQAVLVVKSDEKELNAKIITEFIKNSPAKKIIIGLFNEMDICYNRVCTRNRAGENAYDFNSIFMFNECYSEIYKRLIFS